MTTIGWLSRHPPLPDQEAALHRFFNGDVRVTWDPRTFGEVRELVARALRYDDIVLVAPLSIIQKLTEAGICPLWAEMEECTQEYALRHPDSAVSAPRGRWLRFVRFRRLTGVDLKFEDQEEVQTKP